MMYQSNFPDVSDFICTIKNKMAQMTDKLNVHLTLYTIFHCEYWEFNNNFLCRGFKRTRPMPEKHIFNFGGSFAYILSLKCKILCPKY